MLSGTVSHELIHDFLMKVPTVIRNRGFNYERDNRVLFFSWNGDQTKLISAVEGSQFRPYQVVISFKRDRISGSCTCPFWEDHVECKHIVAVMYHALNRLPNNKKLEPPCLDEYDDCYILRLSSSGAFYSHYSQKNVRGNEVGLDGKEIKTLLKNVRNKSTKTGVFLESQDTYRRLNWVESSTLVSKIGYKETFLDSGRCCFLTDDFNGVVQELIPLGSHLFISSNYSELLYLPKLPAYPPEFSDYIDYVFRNGKWVKTVVASNLSYRVYITLQGKVCDIECRVYSDDCFMDVDDPFMQFIDSIKYEFGLHAKESVQCRYVLAMLCLISNPSEKEGLIESFLESFKAVIEPDDWNDFTSYFSVFFGNEMAEGYNDMGLVFEQDIPFVFTIETRKVMEMYALLFQQFPNSIKGYNVFSKLSIYEKNLREELPFLLKNLTERGFDLYLNHEKIVASVLDIHIDITSSDDLDWFELKPTVMLGEKTLSQEEWKSVVNNMGVFQDNNGSIHVIDRNMIRALNLLHESSKKEDVSGSKSIIHIPRLHILDWIELKKSGVTLSLPKQEEAILNSLLSFQTLPKVTLSYGFKEGLRNYQKLGVYWLLFLYKHRLGAILADDMGLGKTVQTIAFLSHIKSKKPHLLVVPPSLVHNWQNELERFNSNFSVHTYYGPTRVMPSEPVDIVLTTYDFLRRDKDVLKKISFNVVIFDEAQTLKNIVSKRTEAARTLRADFKLLLSGTPMENHLGEYYSLIDLALPGLLGRHSSFMMSAKQGVAPLYRTKPFVLRRTKSVIAHELPEKVEQDIYLDLNSKQRGLYTKMIASIKRDLTAAYKSKTEAQANIMALTALLRLRQICVSPGLIDASLDHASPKFDYLIDQLHELHETKQSVLIFSQFTSALDLLEVNLRKNNFSFGCLDGSVSIKKRKQLVNEFQEGIFSFFLISLKAGGTGLNLTKATHVFHLDPWWNPAVENQASDRAHRIGQKETVFIHRLLIKDTIEEKMMILKKKKLDLYQSLFEEGKKASPLSREDLAFLLG